MWIERTKKRLGSEKFNKNLVLGRWQQKPDVLVNELIQQRNQFFPADFTIRSFTLALIKAVNHSVLPFS